MRAALQRVGTGQADQDVNSVSSFEALGNRPADQDAEVAARKHRDEIGRPTCRRRACFPEHAMLLLCALAGKARFEAPAGV
jgi:hypothetical protein